MPAWVASGFLAAQSTACLQYVVQLAHHRLVTQTAEEAQWMRDGIESLTASYKG